MRAFSLLLFSIVSFFAVGQVTISGKVLARASNEPIPYANIGIVNTIVGTISNPDGSFELPVPPKVQNDTIVFSALGFERVSIPVKAAAVKLPLTVFLEEKVVVLAPLIFRQQKEKAKTFKMGNPHFNGGVLETDTAYAGGSMALLIENKGPQYADDFSYPLRLEKVSLRILKNNLDTLRFRVRVNALDTVLMQPGRDLLETNVVVSSAMRKGWLNVDLMSHRLMVDRPFFITFEQLLDVRDRTSIADGYRAYMKENPNEIMIDTVDFLGEKHVRKMLKGPAIDLPGTFIAISSEDPESFSCFTRDTSFSPWKRERGIVAATAVLSNQFN